MHLSDRLALPLVAVSRPTARRVVGFLLRADLVSGRLAQPPFDSSLCCPRGAAIELQTNNWSSVLPLATASLSHLGWVPRPVQEFPASSLYFAATRFFAALRFALTAAFFMFLDGEVRRSSEWVLPAPAIAKSDSDFPASRASRNQTGRGPRPTQVLPVPSANFAVRSPVDWDLGAGVGAATDFGVKDFFDLPPNKSSGVMLYAAIATRIFAMTSASSDFRSVSASVCSFAICAWSCA